MNVKKQINMKKIYLFSFLCLASPIFSSTQESAKREISTEKSVPESKNPSNLQALTHGSGDKSLKIRPLSTFNTTEEATAYLQELKQNPDLTSAVTKIQEGIDELNKAAQSNPTKLKKSVNNLKAASRNLLRAAKGFFSAATDAAKETTETVQKDIIPQAKNTAENAWNTASGALGVATEKATSAWNTATDTWDAINKRYEGAEFNTDTDLSGAFD